VIGEPVEQLFLLSIGPRLLINAQSTASLCSFSKRVCMSCIAAPPVEQRSPSQTSGTTYQV
jgi:hypothetical protein